MFQLGQARRRTDAAADRPARGRPGPQQAGEEPAVVQQRRPAVADLARRAARVGKFALANCQRRDRGARPGQHQGLPRRRPDRASSCETHRRPEAAPSRRTPAPAATSRAAGRGGQAGPGARPEARHDPPWRPDRHLQVGERPGRHQSERRQSRLHRDGGPPQLRLRPDQLAEPVRQAGPRARHHPGGGTGRPRAVRLPDRPGGSGEGRRARTTNPKDFAECAGILGDRQPGINYGRQPSGPVREPAAATTPPSAPTAARSRRSATRRSARTPPCRRRVRRPRSPANPAGPAADIPAARAAEAARQAPRRRQEPGQGHHDTVKKLQDLLDLPQLPQLPLAAPAAELHRIQQRAHRQPPQLPPRAMNGREEIRLAGGDRRRWSARSRR